MHITVVDVVVVVSVVALRFMGRIIAFAVMADREWY